MINTRTPGVACAPLVRTRGATKYVREVRISRSIDRVGGVRIRPLSTYLEVRMAAPVRSYCFTVETELIGPAMLNGAPPKHDDMQCVAYVPEMSHFHAQMGRIFADQLKLTMEKQYKSNSFVT
jgi:hypothetical protein